jgi:AcrR family transcriptional regulator
MSISKDEITNACLTLFYKYGIKSISVDDIAHHLGMSKKTFYQFFKNKNQVIEMISKNFINQNFLENRKIINENTDVIDKILKIYKRILEQFHTCNPRFLSDIKKYHQDIYQLFTDFREKELRFMITNLLRQGKEEGIFREDLDEKMIYDLHIRRMNSIIDRTLLPDKYIGDPVFFDTMVISLIGISTIKGHELIQNKINKF